MRTQCTLEGLVGTVFSVHLDTLKVSVKVCKWRFGFILVVITLLFLVAKRYLFIIANRSAFTMTYVPQGIISYASCSSPETSRRVLR